MYNPKIQQDQNYINPEDRSFVRQLGRFMGRILATLGAAVTIRIVGRDVGFNRQEGIEQEGGLLHEIQQELPVAATTLLVWNTGVGAETGANVSEFLATNTRAIVTKFLLGSQQARVQIPSFADNLAQSFMAQMSSTVVQGMQGNVQSWDRMRP